MASKGFLKIMQKKTAVSSVGPSALRGQGKGVLYAVQKTLANINLADIPTRTQKQFEVWLDKLTALLLQAMPVRKKPWGAARKAINLFLRDVLYNQYLCKQYRIDKLEDWLEIPLDSAVATGLKLLDKNKRLPSWPRLKHLTKPTSDQFQREAVLAAKAKGIARVHLDMFLWLENR